MARSTTRIEKERGIVIDPDGFPVAFVQWEKGKGRPSFSIRDNSGEIIERRRVIPGDSYEPGAENWRWTGSGWEQPDVEEVWVDQKGNYRRRVKVFSKFMNRAPDVPPGWAVATSPPPKSRSRRAIFDAEDGQWKFPARKVVLDSDGKVVNRILVDPRISAEAPALPPGRSLIDEPEGVDVVVGHQHVGNGVFKPPEGQTG